MKNRREEFIEGLSYTLKDQKVIWCKLVEPDEFEGKLFWKLTILLDKKLAKAMEDCGMNVKETKDDPPRLIISAKKNCETKKGSLTAPSVLDESGEPLDGSLIGDGSICDVNVYSRYVMVGGREHCPMYLDSIVVKELVTNEVGGESPFE